MTKETEAPELLPCPFCKSRTRLDTMNKRIGKATPHIIRTAQVCCRRGSCGAKGRKFKGEDCKPQAVASWNTRADLPDASYKKGFKDGCSHMKEDYQAGERIDKAAKDKQIEELGLELLQAHSQACEAVEENYILQAHIAELVAKLAKAIAKWGGD